MNSNINKHSLNLINKIVYITILSLASLLMFCLIMSPLVNFCADVANFFKGVFGLSFYGLDIAIIVIFALLLSGKKIVLKPKYVADLIVMYFCVIWLVHLVTSQIYMTNATYSSYLATCFNYSQTPSFGGVVGGIFVFPLAKLNIVFAYVVFVIGIILTCLFAVNIFYKKETAFVEHEREPREYEQQSQKQKPVVTSMDILYGDRYPKPGELPEKTSREQSFEQSINQNSSFLDLFPTKTTKKYDTAPQSKLDLDEDTVNPILKKPDMPYSEYDREKEKNQTKTAPIEQIAFDKKPEQPKQKTESELKIEQARRDFQSVRAIPVSPNNVPIIDGDNFKKSQPQKNDENAFFETQKPQNTANAFDIQNESESDIFENFDSNFESEETTENEKIDEFDTDILPSTVKTHNAIKYTEKPFIATEDVKAYQGMIDVDDGQNSAPPHYYRPYVSPSIDLLNNAPMDRAAAEEDYEENARILEQTLNEFKIEAKVQNIVTGPTVTRYELSLAPGISIKKISNLTEDITRRLSAIGSVRLETTISGKDLFGIEVPNKNTEPVTLRSIIQSESFRKPCSGLRFALGTDIGGEHIAPDLAEMPHLLVAGSTGTGKSVCLNSLIISLMYRYSPEELRFILIDPKRVEFFVYNKMPHLMINEVITEYEKSISAFTWAIEEMERRYSLFAEIGAKNISTYNRIIDPETTQKLPRIVMVVDELSELIMYDKNEVETRIKSLSAKARAAGIHLVLATQRPSVDIITGVIKANLPSRIALRVFSTADSKTILDQGGPEKLLGKGDMLFVMGNTPKPVRLQGALVTMAEVERVVEFVKRNNEAYYDEEVESKISKEKQNEIFDDEDELDPLFMQALEYIIDSGAGVASISMLQRRFSIGYNRAGKIIEDMVQKHFVSGYDGSKSRKVLISKEEFEKLYKND
ncbi:MAG TPA: DNA translocase FtsK [Clostridia bacterium]|nr:DNA translocase FtsK [Clostridia bacterium]